MSDIVRVNRPASWRRDFIVKHAGRCHYCNRRGISNEIGPDDRPWHVDHMTPLSRGGEDVEENLTLSCKRCNVTKGVQPYKSFKIFASYAYWTPDDWRVPEWTLSNLMDRYNATHRCGRGYEDIDPAWVVDADGLRITRASVDEGCRETILNCGAPEDYTLADRDRAVQILHLAADMHRALPALIAEIRMLRAESTDRLDTEDAA